MAMTLYQALKVMINGQELPVILCGDGGAFIGLSTVPGRPEVIRLVTWDGERWQVTNDYWPDGRVEQHLTCK